MLGQKFVMTAITLPPMDVIKLVLAQPLGTTVQEETSTIQEYVLSFAEMGTGQFQKHVRMATL